jgi:hypothetical protein
MSIVIGNLTNENINDNRLKFNSYNNSNIININVDGNSYNDAVINYKNIGEIGISNSFISFNYNNSNIFKANDKQSFFINDIVIKSNINTFKDITNINSNLNINLSNINNSFNIVNNNNNINFKVTNNDLKVNFNNSNKLTINSSIIKFDDNLIINDSKSLIVSNINAFNPNSPIIIDYATFKNLLVSTYTVKNSIIIDNDTIYPNPSLIINKYSIDCNIIDIYNKNINDNSSNKIFSINKNGYIGIGSNYATAPIDIKLNNYDSNSFIQICSNINKYNDKFIINNKGYIGIGTDYIKNQISIDVRDDNRNILNNPVININLNYDRNSNYRTSNIIDLTFIATNEYKPIYNNEDVIIGTIETNYDNFIPTITSNITIYDATADNPPIYEISVINFINNDYINTYNISSIVPYNIYSYPSIIGINFNDVDYVINYTIKYPNFIAIDTSISPIIESSYVNYKEIIITSYLLKPNTILSNVINNPSILYLKEIKKRVYSFNPNDINSFSIFIIQRLYIEKGLYQLKSFVDYLTYVYIKPSDLIYATSNNNFSVSLTSDGKLSLGDKDNSDNYYLYVNKKSRLNNLECANISAVDGKNNINFSLCNLSNINKAFINSNITSNLLVNSATIDNCINSNLFSTFIYSSNIIGSNFYYDSIYGCNLIINSNLFNPNIKVIIGSNVNISSNSANLNINIINNITGLSVNSFNSNNNPSISINGYNSNNYPFIIMSNLNSSYSININSNNKNYLNSDNFSLIDNVNNRIIFKHTNFNDKLNNQFSFGSYNNIIFDLKPQEIPNNYTNKISLGYPYRFLMQQNLNPNNWDNYFKDNIYTSDCMLNVYGNINFSTINNTPFFKCIASDYPNENISINIGSNAISKNGFILNVGDNAYFSCNINVEKDIFVKGTVGNVSDIRLKENIIKISDSINKIEKINGYIYKRTDTGKTETGLIAQEVMNILPEVININNETSNNYYNISYGNMVGLLVEGIKELNNRLKIIENKI